jgi:hypothetical protein
MAFESVCGGLKRLSSGIGSVHGALNILHGISMYPGKRFVRTLQITRSIK